MFKDTIARVLSDIKKVVIPTETTVTSSAGALSVEGFNPMEIANSNVQGSAEYGRLASNMESILSTLSVEELAGVDPVRRDAALKAAVLANTGNLSAFGGKMPAGANANDVTHLSVEDMNLSTETFDPSEMKNALYFTYIINLFGNKQDDFGEAFFPTIIIDPTVSALLLNVELTNIYKEATRSISGAVAANLTNKFPLIKAVYNSDVMSVNSNRVVPVLREESAGVLVADAATTTTVTGENITTAPIKFNQTVDLLGLSSTDAMLAKGQLDNTDALDRSIKVSSVTMSLTGKVGDNTVTEKFTIDIGAYAHTAFMKAVNGHNKAMTLNFQAQDIILKLNMTRYDGLTSQILSADPGYKDLKAKVRLALVGTANTQTGEVTVSVMGTPVIEGVYGDNGVKLAGTSQLYTNIKAILDTMVFEGYTLEAYRTNSNFRTKAQLLTVDAQAFSYPVPIKQGTTVVTPMVPMPTGTDGDANKLANTSIFLAAKMSIDAVNTLVEYSELLSQVVTNIPVDGSINAVDPQVLGIGEFYVNRYFRWQSVNLEDYIDSIKSSDRYDDIRLSLINTIRDLVIKMSIDSNYYIASTLLRGSVGSGNKINVVLGTDPELKNYLTSNGSAEIDIGADYRVTIVSTPNPRVSGQIFLTFTMDTDTKNTEPNPLSFGSMICSPAMSFEIQKSGRDTGSVMETHVVPRYQHYAWLPVMTRLSVVGLSEVLKKVAVNTHAIL